MALGVLISSSSLGSAPVWAGAFPLPAGEGQIIATTDYAVTTHYFDRFGHRVPVPSYRKFEQSAYVEYGLTDLLTLVVQPAFDHIHLASVPSASFAGLGPSAIGAHLAVFRSDTTVLSMQALLLPPAAVSTQRASANPALVGDRDWAGDLRAMLGRSFEIAQMQGFADVEAGYRMRGDGWPNEWRLDLTIGLRPRQDIMLLLQSFNDMSQGVGRLWPRNASTKLQASGVVDLTKSWSIQLGAFETWAGLNAGRDVGPFAGIWYRF